MHGCNQKRIKIIIEVNEQISVSQFKYLGCKMLNGDMNVDIE